MVCCQSQSLLSQNQLVNQLCLSAEDIFSPGYIRYWTDRNRRKIHFLNCNKVSHSGRTHIHSRTKFNCTFIWTSSTARGCRTHIERRAIELLTKVLFGNNKCNTDLGNFPCLYFSYVWHFSIAQKQIVIQTKLQMNNKVHDFY